MEVSLSLLVLLLMLTLVEGVEEEKVRFKFMSFSRKNKKNNNISLVGDSSIGNNGAIRLTNPNPAFTSSSGSLFYTHPISLFMSSFSTTFSFSINNLNPTSSGDGLAFFLTPNITTFPSTTFLAVEFDTHLDSRFSDPNDNHVGFDLDSFNSLITSDPILHGIDLKSGNIISAWIDYNPHRTFLHLFLTYSPSSKPLQPLLSLNLDLSPHLTLPVYVGFSASTTGAAELHQIHSWTFHTITTASVPPHNVSVVGTTFPISRSGPRPKKKPTRGKSFPIDVVAVAGSVSFFFAILGYVLVRIWRGGGRNRKEKDKFQSANLVSCPRAFDYKELKSATREFHPSRIVGHGSFGTVYKAFFISSGTIAAVKRSRHSNEGKTEFLAELNTIAGLRHKNLVQLQGWCVEKGELLLVYDFMANGSLDKMLYKESERVKLLSWSNRKNIALGLASVLVYLHQECEQRVIHRDIKAGNILLDGNFNPRLGDFGLAKLMDHGKSPVSTLTAGTMGYLAPEYLQYGKVTDKTDVFSYGVVVLEVACGRRPIEREGSTMVNLIDWVWSLHSEGKVILAADKRLNGEFQEEEMRKLLLLGLSCANPDSAERPSMRRVLQILNDEAAPPVVPKVKPILTFSSHLPLTIEDIVSDAEDFNTSQSMCEIKIY